MTDLISAGNFANGTPWRITKVKNRYIFEYEIYIYKCHQWATVCKSENLWEVLETRNKDLRRINNER